MPGQEFNQVFTVDFSQIEAAMQRLSAEAKSIAAQSLSGLNVPSATTGPSIAAQAGVLTAAIRRAQQLSGGPASIDKKVEDALLGAFGGSNFSGVTGDPGQAKKIRALQQQISNKAFEELQQVDTAVGIRQRVNTLLSQSASQIVGRSAVSSAKIGALRPAAALESKALEAQAKQALPSATDAEVSALQTQRQRLAGALRSQADSASREAQIAQEQVGIEQQSKAQSQEIKAAQERLGAALRARLNASTAGAGGSSGGGGGFNVPPSSFDPLGGDGESIQERLQKAVKEFNETAAFNKVAAKTPEFLQAKRALATSEANLAAAHTAEEAASAKFVQSKVNLATQQNILSAELAAEQLSSDEFISSRVALAATNNALSAQIASEKAINDDYLDTVTRLAAARNKLAIAETDALGREQALQSATDLATAKLRQQAAENKAQTEDPSFIKAQTDLAASQERLAVANNNARASSEAFVQAKTAENVSQQRLTAALLNEQAESKVAQEATAELAIARSRLAKSEAEALSSQAVLDAAIEARTASLRQEAAQAQRIASDPGIAAANAEKVIAENNKSIAEQRALDQNRSQLAQQRLQQEQLRLRQEVEFTTLASAELVQDKAKLASQQAIFGEQIKLEQANSGLTSQLNRVKAQRIAAEQKANAQFNRILAEELKASGAGLLTRVRARTGGFAGAGGGLGGSGGGLGGFFGGGVLSAARYALPSALLFGAGGGILNTVKEAEELERIFTQLRAQSEAIGEGDNFNKLRDQILEIARVTGNAGDEVANFAFQLQGAFSGETIGGLTGNDLISNQLESISKLNRITDIDNQQVVDSVTAISFAYDELGQSVGDLAVAAESKLGVSIDNTINFLGDIAPVAREAGFELDELTALAALSQQRSGRSGTQLAEAFGRIIPAISGAREEIIQLASANSALRTPELLEALQNNDIAGQFFELARAAGELQGTSAGDQIVELLGGRREAQVLLTVFSDPGSLDRAVDLLSEGVEGGLDKRFDIFEETLNQRFAKLGETFRQLGVSIFEAGIGDLLISMAVAVTDLLSSLILLVEGFNSINESMNNIPKILIAATAAVFGLNSAIKSLGGSSAILTNLATLFPTAANLGSRAGIGVAAGAAQTGQLSLFGPAAGSAAAAAGTSGSITAAGTAAGAAIGAALGVAAAAGIGASIGIQAGRQQSVFGLEIPEFDLGFIGLEELGSGATAEDLSAQRQALLDRLVEVDRDTLTQLADDQRNAIQRTFDGLASFFTGVDTSLEGVADDALRLQDTAGINEAFQPVIDAGGADGVKEALLQGIEQLNIDERRSALLQGINDQYTRAEAEALDEFLGRNLFIDDKQVFVTARGDAFVNQFATGDDLGFTIDTDVLESLLSGGDFDEIINQALDGSNEQAVQLLRLLQSIGADSEAIDAALIELEGKRREALSESELAAEKANEATASAEAALAAFEAGRGGFGDYLAALDEEIALWRQSVGPNPAQADLEQINERLSTRASAVADFASQQDELTIQIQNLIGGNDLQNIQGEIDVLVSRLNDPNFTDTDGRLDYANQLIELQQAFYDASIANASSAEEALAIAQAGVPVLPEVRAELIAAQIRATASFEFGSLFEDGFVELYSAGEIVTFESADAFVSAVAQAIAAGGDSLDRMRDVIEGKIATLKGALVFNLTNGGEEFADEYNTQIQDLQQALEAINIGDPTALTDENIIDPRSIRDQQAIEKAEKEAERAREEAAREAERAAQERARAAEEAKRQAEDLARARLEYALALVSGDPVKASQIAIQQADLAYKQAETEADRLRAQAQKVAADRQLQDAIRDISNAQFELIIAQAEFAGDMIGASQISLQQAQQRLAQLQADFSVGNAGQADVIRGQADVVRAQSAARDAQLQSSLDDYAFLYEMERINKQQYIAYLQSLKQIPDLTEEQIRSIDRQIKGLASELRSDFQFNLPTNLALPTLYEARRVNQGTGGGIGYQDNRNVQLFIQVNDSSAIGEVEALLESHLGNNRLGASSRRY